MERRVVITGMGIWSCIGTTLDEVCQSLFEGRSGIVFSQERKDAGFRSPICGNVPQPDLKKVLSRNVRQMMPEEAQYAYMATVQALEQARLTQDYIDSQQTRAALSEWQNCHNDEYISVVVNNAGIRRDGVLALMPESDWHCVIDITLPGFYNVTQPLLPAMQLHKFGRIVNMASVSGLKGLPGQRNYSAAKGGIIVATKALAQEVARRNITVNAIAPGFIKTDMTEGLDEEALKQQIPMRRFGTPQEVADAVAFLVSPQAGYITGNVISINGGLYT